MTQSAPPWRQIIRESLELISSETEQLEYERNVPRFDITPEILAAWSSNYHPNNPVFVSLFNASELEAMARFERCFRERVRELPNSQGTVQSWLATTKWKEVMSEASVTLCSLAA
jgi:hypothetical protein